ncbi:eukaryotic aspartyl protease protein [Apiospora aurea]|uniref:Eukaryotic aspartyl protease protein n=1 Tax=Apiospora aurea TaxID=335848 RepID=A0ABR1Q7K6_9PEZI
MLPLFFLLVGCCLSLPSEPHRQLIPQSDIVPSLSIPGVEMRRARPFSNPLKAAVANKSSGSHAKLKRLPKSHSHRQPSAAAFFAEHRQSDAGTGTTTPTGNVSVVDRSATQYSVEVILNGSPFNLIMNTAGSDTWVRSRNFTCLNNATGSAPIPQCDWGKSGATGFPKGPIQNQHFAIKNADGSGVSGQLGYMNVSLANIAVPNQEVAIATQGIWHGDNVTSGMLGMAYPSLTSAYSGDDMNDTSDTSALEYSPFLPQW